MRKVDLDKWQKYFTARNTGLSVDAAAKKARLSNSTAYRFERGDPTSGGLEAASLLGISTVGGNLVAQPLSPEAQLALEDFSYFRMRYFGRKSLPWQERAAYEVLRSIESRDREYVVMNEPPGSGKALALDTPLATPIGWTTMGEIQSGDYLLGEHGQPVRVLATTEVMFGRECFEVFSDDGGSVVADADHDWLLRRAGMTEERLWTSRKIANPRPNKNRKGGARPKKLQNRVVLEPTPWPSVDLPIDPYVLGVWIGDGCYESSSVSMDTADSVHVRKHFEEAGYATTDRAHPYQFGVLGLRSKIAKLDGKGKRIPDEYMSGSPHQRLALLQGLMDSDGSVRPDGLCVFSNTRGSLVRQVQRLVWSLGYKCSIRSYETDELRRTSHQVFFYMKDAARLPRKTERTIHPKNRSFHRGMTAKQVPSVPVKCVQVEGGLYLAGESLLLTHNSTLFTHDIPCWLIARDRTIRIQIGSRTERQARMYVSRMKRSLERDAPLRTDADSLSRGISFDAASCLQDDFGAFKPEGRTDLWRGEALVVRQLDGVQLDDKEPTVSAWGQDSGFLGGRFDFVLWDDLVDRKNTKTSESKDQLREWWDAEAETRLEPGGTLLLQGQRIQHDDLYRYCLDKQTLEETPKYRHVVYKAHDEDICTGNHDEIQPWPKGCLLDPHRLPWKHLETLKHNNPRSFAIMYQQEDADVVGGLVDIAWITGGQDVEGYPAPGCLDRERVFLEPPVNLLNGNGWSFITVDPSPTEWWGIIWWLYDPDSGNRYIIDLHKRRMNPEQFLSLDLNTFDWSGLIHEMFYQSCDLSIPISHVVVEVNAAQRWLLSQPHVQKWAAMTGVAFVPHTTSINKQDPKYGLESIGDLFRQGMIRIPWGDMSSRVRCQNLIDESTRYPDFDTTDLIMSTWFGKLAVENHYTPRREGLYTLNRPAWLGYGRRGIA